ncbi:MAG: protein kinase [Xanthomonadales bacterium]|nr:protein kinase [Xanthomonadales bacterium]
MSLPEIPGYRILRQISEGKRSKLYLAEQESLSRQVALKVLSDEFYRDPAFKKRFIDEGKSAAQLNHPNILAVFDIGSVAGFPYIATEYLPGGTLRDRLKSPLEPSAALRVAREIAAALEFSHRHGIAHRDIKPVNIMFRVDGSAVLADPGVVSAAEQNQKLSIGSPHYMSPEQVQAMPVDLRSDFYTLGVVLFEMLTGKLPFDHDDPFQVAAKHLSDPLPKLPQSLARFQPLLDRLLAKDVADRPADALALIAALDALADNAATGAVSVAATPKKASSSAARPVQKPPPPSPSLSETAVVQRMPAASELAATTTMPNPTLVVEREDVARSAGPAPTDPARPRARKPKPRWPALLAALLLLAAIVVGAVWLLGGKADVPVVDRPGEARPQAAQLSGSQAADPTRPEVERWLAEAREQFNRNQILTPEDDNAVLSYKRALKLDPSNAQALQGLEEVVARIDTTVTELISRGDMANARLALTRALAYFPERERFKLLERRLSPES